MTWPSKAWSKKRKRKGFDEYNVKKGEILSFHVVYGSLAESDANTRRTC